MEDLEKTGAFLSGSESKAWKMQRERERMETEIERGGRKKEPRLGPEKINLGPGIIL
jgi:hypothetical protein